MKLFFDFYKFMLILEYLLLHVLNPRVHCTITLIKMDGRTNFQSIKKKCRNANKTKGRTKGQIFPKNKGWEEVTFETSETLRETVTWWPTTAPGSSLTWPSPTSLWAGWFSSCSMTSSPRRPRTSWLWPTGSRRNPPVATMIRKTTEKTLQSGTRARSFTELSRGSWSKVRTKWNFYSANTQHAVEISKEVM